MALQDNVQTIEQSCHTLDRKVAFKKCQDHYTDKKFKDGINPKHKRVVKPLMTIAARRLLR
jgi:hypothetical protein